jgi:hypothetical protein
MEETFIYKLEAGVEIFDNIPQREIEKEIIISFLKKLSGFKIINPLDKCTIPSERFGEITRRLRYLKPVEFRCKLTV